MGIPEPKDSGAEAVLAGYFYISVGDFRTCSILRYHVIPRIIEHSL